MPEKNEPYVLWLASAWPNRLSPYNGDFVMRHAQATSAFVKIHVVSVVRDVSGVVTKSVLREEKTTGGLTETIIYYYCPKGIIPIANTFRSVLQYRGLLRESVRQVFNEKGMPRCMHVHWGMKAGLEAMYVKRKWKIPYIVTEHWTGFLPEASDHFGKQRAIIRKTWTRLLYGASECQVVSATLKDAMLKRFPGLSVSVIPNVTDTRIFFPREMPVHTKRFIHVSGLDDFKDPGTLFHAFQQLLKQVPDAELFIYGSEKKEFRQLAETLGISDQVRFHAEVPQQVLAEAFNTSAALILCSRYETFGCVQTEANACGLPVIVSDLPVFRERVREGVNGSLVPSGDPAALAAAMLRIVKGDAHWNKDLIARETAEKYAYPVIGKMIAASYDQIVPLN